MSKKTSKTKQQNDLDRVTIEYNPQTRKYRTEVSGDFPGIALALAHALRTQPDFARALTLAMNIRSFK